MDDLPFKTEYAKSNRSSCKKCKVKIDKDELRVAALVQSFRHDGKDCHWFHFECFFAKHRPKSIDEIGGVENLRAEDQKKIREKCGKLNEILLPESSSSKGKGKKRKAVDERLKDFRVEYAKSGRSTCAGCGNMIPKGEVRVIHIVYDTDVGARFGQQPISHHPSCFNEIRGDYNYYLGGADLMGFSELAKEDREMIKNAIKPIEIDEKMAKKLKSEPVDKKEAVEMSQLEKLIEKQAKVLFKIRDTIKGITKKGDLQNILFVNDSGMVSGQDGLLDRVADFLTFGAIEKCPKCGKGDLIFGKGGYYCNGQIDEWTLCENFIEKPKRRKCKIPRELKETQNFFTKYQPRVEDRAVRPRPVEIKKQVKEEIGTEKTFKVQREKEPLDGLHLYVVGNLEGDKTILKSRIEKLGGRLVKTLQEKIAAVISTEAEVKKMSKKMQEVKELNIQVVPENFIDVVKKLKRSEAIEKITEMAICDWGSDPLSRIPSEQEMAPKVREDIYERRGANKPKQLVVKLKNGSALDPETGLEDIAHVYRDKTTNLLYTTVLNYVDIQKNKNSYYKLQVLEADNEKKYWLFRSWGRVGTGVGEKKLETYYSVNEACEQFERLFEEKSGNIFGTPFKKMPNKYALVEVDYTDDEKVKAIQEKSAIPSKLPSPVQDIIKMIFDVDAMKQTMLEFELDLEKMPLGKISRKQLEEAYSVLNKLDNLITEGADRSAFIGASNKFFSLVPHSFGMRAAPVIDSVEAIKSKREMIDSLLEIEIAYSMLKDDTKENVNPIDSHYEKLKTEIHPLDKKSKEYEIIQRYVENTHAPTHDQYKLEIDQVFKVSRQGEKRRYKPFQKLHNRQLLWHGSRVTNYAGILSHGLKIAPPEAPVTGYMFGKGIYFADMVSKSANYCATSPKNPVGLMLLSEVALGDMHELTKASFIKKLPDGKFSVKGIGKTHPHPEEHHKLDSGVIVPYGKPTNNEKIRSELLYNEYIVYDVAQVHIQYLLKLKFNYKRN